MDGILRTAQLSTHPANDWNRGASFPAARPDGNSRAVPVSRRVAAPADGCPSAGAVAAAARTRPPAPAADPHTQTTTMSDEDEKFSEETGLEKEQIVVLRRAFESFDKDKQGFITAVTVGDILRMMGIKVSSSSLKAIIEEIDEDGSGEIEFPEFLQLSAKFLIEEDEEAMLKELKEAFRLYDKEGNGYITTQTLKEILHELDPRLTEEELVGIIEEIDEDGSGTVDFDEFMAMMTG
ncbi:Troponin C, isoform 1 [Amphibalanus amphitrite]|uniref:Troponin C, isoform 1 n=2 Tax=Amphibalanus amphitrite TaxID=1232801 RepID=A0A6A4WKP5_AMPAM|nr:Troponin C, isoform 1 [Amphibalanus amphitrite]